MKHKDVLEVEFKKKIACSKDVALWNYWDYEHLDNVHSGYKKSDVLYDKNNFSFRVDTVRLPVFRFINLLTPIFMVQHDKNTLYAYAIQLGTVSKTTISVKEIRLNFCEITMNYKFYLDGWRKILRPILKILIPKWNQKVWDEDYNVKIRRQKMLNLGFRDFIGLPQKKKDRKSKNDYLLKLPIARPRKSPRDLHPLGKNSSD